jgi:hypothetical protein
MAKELSELGVKEPLVDPSVQIPAKSAVRPTVVALVGLIFLSFLFCDIFFNGKEVRAQTMLLLRTYIDVVLGILV